MSGETRRAARAQAGFTLIELLVAMVVTMIITGAMYGLLAGGQNAFRREPELTDRQQAIRLSMDRIQRDVTRAGESLGTYSQVFRDLPDGANANVPSPNGGFTDILEFLTHSSDCPDIHVDRSPLANTGGTGISGQGNSVNIFITAAPPACVRVPGMILVVHDNGATKPAWASNVPANDRVSFALGQQPAESGVDSSDDFRCGQALPITQTGVCQAPNQYPRKILSIQTVRYMIWNDTDGIPSLWRSDTGGLDAAGNYQNPPSVAGNWRLVGRGVEDLQVQYRGPGSAAPAVWSDRPGAVDAVTPNPDTVVTEVRVTLGSRTVAENLQGARTSATRTAVRGQLVSIMSPRAALFNLSQTLDAGGNPIWH